MSRTPAIGAGPPDLPGYRLIQHIGAGGNAQVYLYEQDLPHRKVAVKVLNESALSEAARRRFTAEANVTAGLAHRHIVQVFDANVTRDGRPYLVMPYYPQPNLSVRARRSHFSVADVLRIGIQIGSAVETSHRQDVLHRDIKPQNILTDSYGEPALTDFGIATTTADDGPEGLSVPWSPPEILYGTGPGDQRSDVYSLGATLWHLLVGRSPFELPGGDNTAFALMGRIKSDPPPRTQRADVPGSLERLLRQAMAKDPAGRPQSAMELIRGLQSVEQELRLPLTHPILPTDESPGDTRGGDTVTRVPAAPEAPSGSRARWNNTGQTGHHRQGGRVQAGAPHGSTEAARARSGDTQDARAQAARALAGNPQAGNPQAGNPQTGRIRPGDTQAGDTQAGGTQAGGHQAGQPPWNQTAQPPWNQTAQQMAQQTAQPPWSQTAQPPWGAAAGPRSPDLPAGWSGTRGATVTGDGVLSGAEDSATRARGPVRVDPWGPPVQADDDPTRRRGPVRLDPWAGAAPGGGPQVREFHQDPVAPDPVAQTTMARPTRVRPVPAADGTARGARHGAESGPRVSRRVLAVGGGVLLAAVAAVAFFTLGPGHGQPGGARANDGQTQTAGSGGGQNALGPGSTAPGQPAVTARSAGASQVSFSWTYANPEAGDTFRWQRVSGSGGSPGGTPTGPKVVVSLPAGHSVCIVVQVRRAGGQASDPSEPACWPS